MYNNHVGVINKYVIQNRIIFKYALLIYEGFAYRKNQPKLNSCNH